MMKKSFFIFLAVIVGLNTFAQTKNDGFYQLRMKQMKSAKAYFDSKTAENPADAKILFGLGEYYMLKGNKDSALFYYQKGITTDKKNPYNYVGLAKIALSNGDNANATLNIEAAKKAGKKDANVFVELANMYLDSKDHNVNEAKNMLTTAKEINAKCSGIYYLLAKIALESNNASDAANQFESSIFFDSTYFESYFGVAKIYSSALNTNGAIDYLKGLVSKAPYCVLAYRELGELYFKIGKYSESKDAYKIYIEKAEYSSDEKERYAYALFFSKELDEAKRIIVELSNNDPENYIMLRLLAYTHCEKGEYEQSKDLFTQFFTKIPENKVLALDYEYYAKTLEKLSLDSLAGVQYEKGFAVDSTRGYLLDEAARVYTAGKVYDKAAYIYEKQFNKKDKSKLQNADYYKLGKAFYYAGSALLNSPDTLRKNEFLIKADTLFGTVYTLNPKSHLGLLWRARTNSCIDPGLKRGLAKPYYEKATQDFFIADPVKYKNEIIESYTYLGYYYIYFHKDFPLSKSYWNKILELDPENIKAKEALQGFAK
jgi:tetratricopeptide (TPR) repeat protein